MILSIKKRERKRKETERKQKTRKKEIRRFLEGDYNDLVSRPPTWESLVLVVSEILLYRQKREMEKSRNNGRMGGVLVGSSEDTRPRKSS